MKVYSSKTPKKTNIKLVKKATFWYADKLLSKRIQKSITIKIRFLDNLYKKTGCLGFCEWVGTNEKPRNFIIELDSNLSEKATLRTIAHEMVHVKQYATGQLKDYMSANGIKWEGKLFNKNNSINDLEEYWLSPWEIEAYGLEVGLYNLFRTYFKETKLYLE